MGLFYVSDHESAFQRRCAGALKKCDRVLDVGTGEAHGSGAAETYGIGAGRIGTTVSIDVRSEQRPDVVGDMASLPFPDRSFGIVFVESVLEHVSPLSKVNDCIDEIHRVLAEEGLLVGFVPSCFHFHGRSFPDPLRLTYDGVDRLLSSFEQQTIEAIGGPFSVFLDSLPRGGYRTRKVVEPYETKLRYAVAERIISTVDVSLRTPESLREGHPAHPYVINSTGFRFFARK